MKNVDTSVKVDGYLTPASTTAATVTGAVVDRKGFDEVTLTGKVGAASGSPSAQSVIYKVQDSADGSTDWQDVANGTAAALTADGDEVVLRVPSAYNLRRYLRLAAVVSFTGGSSPAIIPTGNLLLSQAHQEPVTQN